MTNRVTRVVAGKPKRYAYPRYFFSNRSEDILGLCEWALDLLGVARPAAVAVLDAVAGAKS